MKRFNFEAFPCYVPHWYGVISTKWYSRVNYMYCELIAFCIKQALAEIISIWSSVIVPPLFSPVTATSRCRHLEKNQIMSFRSSCYKWKLDNTFTTNCFVYLCTNLQCMHSLNDENEEDFLVDSAFKWWEVCGPRACPLPGSGVWQHVIASGPGM